MPQGTIRKGFFFYFGLFVLMLFAIFLVCIVIMIFNPGKTVLWMQYFTDNTTYAVTETSVTEENETAQDINWTEIFSRNDLELEINCNYADVIVQRNGGTEYTKDGLYIVNNAKGFTAAKSAVPFNVYTHYDGSNKLKIEITEPQGFLYFSKNIKVILHAAGIDGKTSNFSNLKLTVTTTDGDVNLGSTKLTQEQTQLKSAHISTVKGNIIVAENFVTSSLEDLALETVSGDIVSRKKIDENITGIETNCNVKLSTSKGNISLQKLSGKDIKVTCEKGTVTLDNVFASGENGINFLCERGNIALGTVNGNLNFSNAEDWINAPNITINTINGNFTLSATKGGSPNVNITKISGFLNVVSTKGKLNVAEASGNIKVDSDGDLSVYVGVANGNNNAIEITNVSGYVGVDFAGTISSNVVLKNNGNINVNLTKLAKFEANFYKNNNSAVEQVPLELSKIVVKIDNKLQPITEPSFKIEDGAGNGNMEIYTDSAAYINLTTPKTSKTDVAA